jgi:DNA-directed RNA polymerase beta' subunit
MEQPTTRRGYGKKRQPAPATAPTPTPAAPIATAVQVGLVTTQPIRQYLRAAKAAKDNDLTNWLLEEAKTVIEKRDLESTLPELTILGSEYHVLSYQEIRDMAAGIQITNAELSGAGSVNDPGMGSDTDLEPCATCHITLCFGHYGYIDLGEYGSATNPKHNMIYNPLFIRDIVRLLNILCPHCGNLAVPNEKQEEISRLPVQKRAKALEDAVKNIKECPNRVGDQCGPIYHFSIKKEVEEKGKGIIYVKAKKKKEAQEEPYNIQDAFDTLDHMTPKALEILGLTERSHPRNLIVRAIPVIPPRARPMRREGGRVQPDYMTKFYQKFVTVVNELKAATDPGTRDLKSREAYKEFYNFLLKADKRTTRKHDKITWVQNIQGKEALPRQSIFGKRAAFCARTVANPGAYLRYGQVGIPRVWAPILVVKQIVTSFNWRYLTELMNTNKVTYIVPKSTGVPMQSVPDRYELQIGDEVNRHLQSGDRLYVNRQPTLSKYSYMSQEVVLIDALTIDIHLSTTPPYNADFDGDEMNVRSAGRDPRTRAEAEDVSNITALVVSSATNKPIIGLVQNAVTGIYLMSHPDVVVDKDVYFGILKAIGYTEQTFPMMVLKCIAYGKKVYSGATLISFLFPDDFEYDHAGVFITSGILVDGRLKRAHVGGEHRSIIQELSKYPEGDKLVETFLTHAPWMVNRWLSYTGFTTGLLDLMTKGLPTSASVNDSLGAEVRDTAFMQLRKENQARPDPIKQQIDRDLTRIYNEIDALGERPKDDLAAIKWERKICSLVDNALRIGTILSKDILANEKRGIVSGAPAQNALLSMAESGAKGDPANVGAMVGLLGQQFLYGKRQPRTLTHETRILPHDERNSLDPRTQGFVAGNYSKGMSPPELFFAQSAAREGAIDTALNTEVTGTVQRKLTIALQDFLIGHDGSVRNTMGYLYMPVYGIGYSVSEQLKVQQRGGKTTTSFIDIRSTVRALNNRRGWYESSRAAIIKKGRERTANETVQIRRVAALAERPIIIQGTTPEQAKAERAEIDEALDINYEETTVPEVPSEEETEIQVTTFGSIREEYNRPYTTIERKQILPQRRRPRPLSRYEKARIIGERAALLDSNVARPLDWMEDEDMRNRLLDQFRGDTMRIAEYEFNRGRLDDVTVLRHLPGTQNQAISVPASSDHIVFYRRPKVSYYLPFKVVADNM